MLSWCKSKGAKNGAIATLPDVPGVLLFSSGHVGVYIGGGYAVEARGFNYGVVKTRVKDRTWTDWSYMPASILEYDTTSGNTVDVVVTSPTASPTTSTSSAKTTYELGERTLRSGSKGEDVNKLQEYLVKLGYDLGTYGKNKDGVDGDMGSKTIEAVKKFQADHNLDIDGVYGKKSHAAMLEAISGIEKNEKPEAIIAPNVDTDVDTGADIDTDTDTPFMIKVTGNSVNVRNAPSTTTGKIKYIVHKNDILTAVCVDVATNWFKLQDGNYISYKYTRRV